MSDICKEIGGYFGLEMRAGVALHENALALNSARNALVYLINAKNIRKIYLPVYNCNATAEAIVNFCKKTETIYYNIDENFEPIIDDIKSDEYLYRINYHGLMAYAKNNIESNNVIFDNSQSFFSKPSIRSDTIYCPRKFIGVSDGGYLYTDAKLAEVLERDVSWDHSLHLLKRIDCGGSSAYSEFQVAERSLEGRTLKRMSRLTEAILGGIDYVLIKKTRRENFIHVHKKLRNYNDLTNTIDLAVKDEEYVPMCYPFYTDEAERIRNKLISERVYVPIYWPHLRGSKDLNAAEFGFVNNIINLPIDQRYTEADMEKIIGLIKRIIS